MYGKKAAKYDQGQVEKVKERLEQNLDGKNDDSKPSHRISLGLNVFMMTPSFDAADPRPWVNVGVHYGPFHLCLRGEAVEKKNGKGETYLKTDSNFANCPRCMEAWNTWADAGRPEGARKKKFQYEMSNDVTLVNVLDLSPFFKFDDENTFAEPKTSVIKKWMKTYCEIVDAVMKGDEFEIPEDMPEDMARAAQIGYDVLILNKTTGEKLRKTYRKQSKMGGGCPLWEPENYLLQLNRQKDGKTFKGSKGEDIESTSTDVAFAPLRGTGWKLPKQLLTTIEQSIEDGGMVDIHNFDERKTETVAEAAKALKRLTPDQLAEYLEENNHTHATEGFGAPVQEDSSEVDYSIGGDNMKADPSDPNSVGASPFAKGNTSELGAMRDRLLKKSNVDDEEIPY